jgi:hypothetical protein
MNLAKFLKIASSPLSYNEENKAVFHRLGKQVLKQVAIDLGLQEGTFEVRSNLGGIAVSGEVTLHGDKIYVQISQSCMGRDGDILYRSCKGRKDYTGGMNNFMGVSTLVNEYKRAIQNFKEVI